MHCITADGILLLTDGAGSHGFCHRSSSSNHNKNNSSKGIGNGLGSCNATSCSSTGICNNRMSSDHASAYLAESLLGQSLLLVEELGRHLREMEGWCRECVGLKEAGKKGQAEMQRMESKCADQARTIDCLVKKQAKLEIEVRKEGM